MSLTIHLIRHGHTRYTGLKDASGRSDSLRVAGSTDVALSDEGRTAAQRLAKSLEPDHIHSFYASNLSRAVDTAKILGATHVQQDRRLRELDFGEWEDLEWQEVQQKHPRQLAKWRSDWVNIAPPGGEAFIDIAARASDWLQEIKNTTGNSTQQLVVTAHAGIIRAMLCRALDLPLSHAMKFSIDYVHVTTLLLRKTETEQPKPDNTGDAWDVQCLRLNAPHF